MSKKPLELKVPDSFADTYRQIGESLRTKNRFHLPTHLEELVSSFIDYRKKRGISVISPGTRFYRARTHGITQEQTFPTSEMREPPSHLSSAGRLNCEGMPILYLADSVETAIAEVRPWKGAVISVAEVVVVEPISSIKLMPTGETVSFGSDMQEARDFLGAFVLGVTYFASPNHAGDPLAYLPTQYISQRLRDSGFGAIFYPSALNEKGENLSVFDPTLCYVKSVKKYTVSNVNYIFSESVA